MKNYQMTAEGPKNGGRGLYHENQVILIPYISIVFGDKPKTIRDQDRRGFERLCVNRGSKML